MYSIFIVEELCEHDMTTKVMDFDTIADALKAGDMYVTLQAYRHNLFNFKAVYIAKVISDSRYKWHEIENTRHFIYS